MSKKVNRLLKQLKDKELSDLLKYKKIKVPESWKRKTIVELLSVNVSERDINQIMKSTKRMSPQLKGAVLEKKVMAKFSKMGFKVDSNTRIKGFAEFDVTGWKEVGTLLKSKKWIFVECKNKVRVIPKDWKKFLGNFITFKKRKKIPDENITGYLITTGLFHPEVKKEARRYPNIKLQRLKI